MVKNVRKSAWIIALSVVLCVLMTVVCFALFGSAHAETVDLRDEAAAENSNFAFILDTESDTAIVTGLSEQGKTAISDGDSYKDFNIEIPATCKIDGVEKTVSSISSYAFSPYVVQENKLVETKPWFKFLKAVTLPASMTGTAASAFRLSGIITIDMSAAAMSAIAQSVFTDCKSLVSIVLPNEVTTIGNYAFSGCASLASVTLPDGVTTIGDYAFRNCTSLASVALPDGVTTIGNYAFRNCTSLASVALPGGVTTIGNYVFSECTSLASIALPDGVTTIGNFAFYKCTSLTSVALPDGITTIGNFAFNGCADLTDVAFPAELTTIGNTAFSQIGIMSVDLSATKVNSIGDYAFSNCENLTEVILPETTETIGKWSFAICEKLENIDLSKTLITEIPYRAFYSAGWNVQSATLKLPAGLQKIGARSFMYLNAPVIEFPESLTEIGFGAFVQSRVVDLIIPGNVKTIGEFAFASCDRLKTVVIEDGVETIGDYAFAGNIANTIAHEHMSKQINGDPDYAIYGNNPASLKELTVPASVMQIGAYAFSENEGLLKVTIGKSGDAASTIDFTNTDADFNSTTQLRPVSAAERLSVKQSVFYGDYALKQIVDYTGNYTEQNNTDIVISADGVPGQGYRVRTFNGKVYSSDTNNFYKVNATLNISADVAVPVTVTFYKDTAADAPYILIGYECAVQSLYTLNLSDVLRTAANQIVAGKTVGEILDYGFEIGESVFAYNWYIEKFVVPGGVTKINENAFYACGELKQVDFSACNESKKLKEIGEAAFSHTALQTLTVPNGVEIIGSCAFANCVYGEPIDGAQPGTLISVSMPTTLKEYGNNYRNSEGPGIFKGANNLVSVTVPTTAALVPYMFQDTSKLKTVTFIRPEGTADELKESEKLAAIPSFAFFRSGIESIEIPECVNTVEAQAFQECSSLKAVTFKSKELTLKVAPVNNVSVWFGCFVGCAALETVSFADVETLVIEKVLDQSLYGGLCGTSSSSAVCSTNLKTIYLPKNKSVAVDASAATPEDGNYVIRANGEGTECKIGQGWYEDIKALVSKNPDVMVIAPNKEIYDNVVGKPGAAKGNYYWLTSVTFELYTATGATMLNSIKQTKLAKEDGASIKYDMQTVGGVVSWYLNEGYWLPEDVNGYTADRAAWTTQSGAAVTVDYLVNADDIVFKQYTRRVNVAVPTDITVNYGDIRGNWTGVINGVNIFDGKPYELESVTFDNTTDAFIDANAAGYSVTVKLTNEDYQWTGNPEAKSATFKIIVVPREIGIAWQFTEFEGKAVNKISESAFEADYVGSSYRPTATSDDAVWNEAVGASVTLGTGIVAQRDNGGEWNAVSELQSAGSYRLYIDYTIAAIKNFVCTVDEITLRILPAAIDLNLYSNMHWIVGWGSGENSYVTDLRGGELYVYNEAAGDGSGNTVKVPYYGFKRDENGNTVDGGERVYVEQSYARYRADGENPLDMTVRIIANDFYDVVYAPATADPEAPDFEGTATAGKVGVYTAKARLTAKNDYKFTIGLANDLRARGVTITVSDDGKTAICSKVWYIVQIDNGMLDASSAGGVQKMYTISDWIFGAGQTVAAPRLEHGDESDDYLTNSVMRFTLSRDKTVIGEERFARSRFAYYINPSMPVGDYELRCEISDVAVGAHTHWWGGEVEPTTGSILYRGATVVLKFSVLPAEMQLDITPTEKGYADYSWRINSERKGEFFAEFEKSLMNKVNLVRVTPEGYWVDQKVNGSYDVAYNFARMNNNRYLSPNDGNIQNLIEVNAKATYIVYFIVSAPNHAPCTTALSDDRYEYFFTVTVFDLLDIPVVNDNGLVYTGNKVLPEVEENALYTVIWDGDDTYVNGGTHSVSFELTDSVHYRWVDADGKEISDDVVTVEFTVSKAQNIWIRDPNIVDWQFETFDTDINRIRAVPKFLDDGKTVSFSIVTESGADIDGLKNFVVNNDGTIDTSDAALLKALNGLKYGAYKLNVKVEGTENYLELLASIDFRIDKAMNSWADGENDLTLPSWIVGQYDPEVNEIVVNAAHGTVKIVITDIDGNEYYNSETGLNNLKECEVGKYLLKASVAESENYAALAERTFTIEVFKKIGLPWWATLCITVGALLLAALIIFILWKKGVFQILTEKIVVAIRTRASVDATIASVRAAKRMEEGKKSVAEAKRRERIEELRKKSEEARALPPEERAAQIEAKAQAEAERAEKSKARSEKLVKRANRIRKNAGIDGEQPSATDEPAEPVNDAEAAATENDDNNA